LQHLLQISEHQTRTSLKVVGIIVLTVSISSVISRITSEQKKLPVLDSDYRRTPNVIACICPEAFSFQNYLKYGVLSKTKNVVRNEVDRMLEPSGICKAKSLQYFCTFCALFQIILFLKYDMTVVQKCAIMPPETVVPSGL